MGRKAKRKGTARYSAQTVYLTESERDRAHRQAAVEDRPVSVILRRALLAYLDAAGG